MHLFDPKFQYLLNVLCWNKMRANKESDQIYMVNKIQHSKTVRRNYDFYDSTASVRIFMAENHWAEISNKLQLITQDAYLLNYSIAQLQSVHTSDTINMYATYLSTSQS